MILQVNPECHVVKSEWFWNSIQIQERAISNIRSFIILLSFREESILYLNDGIVQVPCIINSQPSPLGHSEALDLKYSTIIA
jgi:hypothetical protein